MPPFSGYGQGPSPHRRITDADENDDWRGYKFVQVYVERLPPHVTTWHIYQNFYKYGTVSKIVLLERIRSRDLPRAEIRFEPPPKKPFWRQFRWEDFLFQHPTPKGNAVARIRVSLSRKQPKNFTVPSPVRPRIEFNEEMTLSASSIDFGILSSPETMQIMATTHGEGPSAIQLSVNLRNLEIGVHFPFVLESKDSGLKTREFRFQIALDESFRIMQVTPKSGCEEPAFIIHLPNPPWYSKKLEEAKSLSHLPRGKRWSVDDLWTRQTDIVKKKNDHAHIAEMPVSVHQTLNVIDIARWTTFRIKIKNDEESMKLTRILVTALGDFNVHIKETSKFSTVHATETEASIWSLLDPTTRKVRTLEQVLDDVHLSFPIRYQLEVCLSHGWLSEYSLDRGFVDKLARMDERKAAQLLKYVDGNQERVFEPMTVFTNLAFQRPVKPRKIPNGCVELYHATVTATTILWHSPTVEVSNRIIRKFATHAGRFLRVRFEDDSYRGKTRLFAPANGKMVNIFNRVRRTLKNGIRLGDRLFKFLAWSNSQLREHGCYFFSETAEVTVERIQASMGSFDHEKIVAKRAARMGQCFSTTRPIHLRLPPVTENNLIEDIIRNGKYNFTDGVGKISRLAAGVVQSQLKIPGIVPSVLQFRLGGCKGILVLAPELPGLDIKIRRSQFKFSSLSGELEIVRWSEFWQACLNRQLIIVLSHLGVPDEVFLGKQREVIRTLDEAMDNELVAIRGLRDNVDPNRMTLVIAELITHGFRNDPFVTNILHLWRAASLKSLKERAKIPISEGAFVLGCVDETATLRGHFEEEDEQAVSSEGDSTSQLPEIFLQITDPQTGKRRIIEEICILARNPSLHPGDIRVVRAVNVPALHHLCDTVVMPQTGDRDIPSMCSGGDLDGDDYIVIWDKDLLPKNWNPKPFHYEAPAPVLADCEIATEQIIDFYLDFMQNDSVGRIAHAHLGAADGEEDGIASDACLKLCELHSLAVDYPKTGIPAVLPRELDRTQWPHYMEKAASSTYKSRKILGQLYDSVKKIKFQAEYSGFDARILKHTPTTEMMQVATQLKHEYDLSLQRIMAQHKIQTEFEIWTTFVMSHSKQARDYKFHEEIGELSKSLKEQYYDAIVEAVKGSDFDHLAPFAIAAYKLTESQTHIAAKELKEGKRTKAEMPFISFPWLLYSVLGKIATSGNVLQSFVQDVRQYDPTGGELLETLDGGVGKFGLSQHLADPYQPAVPPKDDDIAIPPQEGVEVASEVQFTQDELDKFEALNSKRTVANISGVLTEATDEKHDQDLLSQNGSSSVTPALDTPSTDRESGEEQRGKVADLMAMIDTLSHMTLPSVETTKDAAPLMEKLDLAVTRDVLDNEEVNHPPAPAADPLLEKNRKFGADPFLQEDDDL